MIGWTAALLLFAQPEPDWKTEAVCFYQVADHVTAREFEEAINSYIQDVVYVAINAYNERHVPFRGYYIGRRDQRFRFAEYCSNAYISNRIDSDAVFIVEITEAQFLRDTQFILPRYPE